VVVAAAVVGVGELKQLDEDHARKTKRCVVSDEVVDVVGRDEDARGDAVVALRTR